MQDDVNQEFESLEESKDVDGDEVAPEDLGDAVCDKGKVDANKLDLILDIPLTVTVELGRSKMLINDLLQLGEGSVIELTKLVGEPLEVLINSKLVARGEVVVVNEKFGVRLTSIVTPIERVQSLT
jgi:flagellar motor switch protein FliN/FliY|tara:strand:- start:410 stop:787 length:378 start_codon:yes stop_codon:yes gene_type:complete